MAKVKIVMKNVDYFSGEVVEEKRVA